MGAFIPYLVYAAGTAAVSFLLSSCSKNVPPPANPQQTPKKRPIEAGSAQAPPIITKTPEAQLQGIQKDPKTKSKTVYGFVQSEGKSVAGATVLLTHIAKGTIKTVTTDSNGGFKIPNVKPGQQRVVVFSENHLLDAKEYFPHKLSYNFNLTPRPKEPSVEIVSKEIILKKKIIFKKRDNGDISPYISEKSAVVLRELAEAILKNPHFKKIEIQAHNGVPDEKPWDIILSKDRARAVLRRLVKLGVSLLKLKAEGYGLEQPLVPGTSPSAQEKNERIQVLILE